MKAITGRIYILAGQGEMLCTDADSMRFATHGMHTGGYWAQPHEVVREATAEDLRRRDEQARPRGVACDDPECWCRGVLDTTPQAV